MKSLRLALLVLLLAAFAFQATAVHAQGCGSKSGYYVASLNGGIDPGAADFMTTTVSNAESSCAGTIVFVLTTNGGDGASMESMVSSIEGYQQWGGVFITLVAPQGAYAFSAGSYVAEASTYIYMAPGTTIGAATPIVSGIPVGEENSTMAKDIGAFTAYMENLASSNGRNATAAGKMVTPPAKSYGAQEAARLGVITRVFKATTLDGALGELNVPAGTPVNTPGISSQFISVLSDPNVSSLLFLVGVFAILADIYHPTFILSIAGIVLIALALLGLGIFGASVVSIILMVVGAAFIFLEIKTQHGISAAIGVVIFAVGFLLIFQGPPATQPPAGQPPVGTFTGISTLSVALLAALGVAVVLGSIYLANLRAALAKKPSQFDLNTKIGLDGTMESDVKAGGRGVANIGSEEWTVTADEDIGKGERVKVKGVKGLHLIVEKYKA